VSRAEPSYGRNRTSGHNGNARTLLFVTNVAWFFLSHRLAVARGAIADGLIVHLASDVEDEAEISEVRSEGIVFHRLHVVRSGLNPIDEVKCLRDLRRVIRHVRPDIVHNVTSKPVIYGTWLARALGTTGIVNAISGFGHVYGVGPHRRLLRSLLDRAYARALAPPNVRVIVQNRQDCTEVTRICPLARERLYLIQGSCVDLATFTMAEEPRGTLTVLLPARLLREKGIYEFAAAAAELRRAGLVARFLLAGRLDPANRGALSAQQVRDLCHGSGVEWVGDCKDMPRLYRESHLVCLPSYYREGVPKALLEACACGKPIVTTDTAGCRDVVQREQNGLLVPPRDAQALAAAIRELLLDPERRKRMGTQARRIAEREFGVEHVVEKHLEIYRDLLVGRKGSGGSCA
jgi:glycosyltransferase involved in cell wall biosynthesis